MARIVVINPGQSVADFSVSGALVTIAGLQVDCEALQEDVVKRVEVRRNAGRIEIGGDGAYVAQIEIPARTYTQSAGSEAEDGEEEAVASSTATPLDANAILVTLWPYA